MDNIAQERAYPTPYANSSLLAALLLSLAVQKHTPTTKKDVKNESTYDFIVVGAGAGGSVVASRLSEMPCCKVLLLEAGKSPPRLTDIPGIARSFITTDIDWKYLTAPQKYTGAGLNNRQVAWPSGKTIGGSTVINAMLNVRGNRQNYDDWTRSGATGWSYEEVLPYFKKLENYPRNLPQDPEFHGRRGPVTIQKPEYYPEMQDAINQSAAILSYYFIDYNGRFQNGFSNLTTTTRRGQRCSAAKAYLVPAENRTNLHIVSEALVTKVIIENKRAVGVEFERNGQRYIARASREVILSAGTVNTAQLLMLSGIGPKNHLKEKKIPLVADLPVGKNFQDHQGAILAYTITDRIPTFLAKLSDRSNIEQYINFRTGPLASPEGITNMALLTINRSAPANAKPDYQIYFVEPQLEVAKNQANVNPLGYQLVFGPFENRTSFWCVSQILNPRSRGSVTLSSADIHDPPIIDPNYFEVDQDMVDVVEGMKKCNEVLSQAPVQRLGTRPYDVLIPGCEQFVNNLDAYFRCQAQSVVITLSHQVGTARMGNPRHNTTVVDPELRVLGVNGLRVVDASVMPIVPSGNTWIPTVMVAEKASDIIKQYIRCHK